MIEMSNFTETHQLTWKLAQLTMSNWQKKTAILILQFGIFLKKQQKLPFDCRLKPSQQRQPKNESKRPKAPLLEGR